MAFYAVRKKFYFLPGLIMMVVFGGLVVLTYPPEPISPIPKILDIRPKLLVRCVADEKQSSNSSTAAGGASPSPHPITTFVGV